MPTSTNTLCSAATSCCVCCRALATALKRAQEEPGARRILPVQVGTTCRSSYTGTGRLLPVSAECISYSRELLIASRDHRKIHTCLLGNSLLPVGATVKYTPVS